MFEISKLTAFEDILEFLMKFKAGNFFYSADFFGEKVIMEEITENDYKHMRVEISIFGAVKVCIYNDFVAKMRKYEQVTVKDLKDCVLNQYIKDEIKVNYGIDWPIRVPLNMSYLNAIKFFSREMSKEEFEKIDENVMF